MSTAYRLTVAEIFRKYGPTYIEKNPQLPQHLKFAARCLAQCQTALLGGHEVECDRCGRREVVYNSCRHRACPQCEGSKSAQWMVARAADLLPVHYFHVVFTVPHILNELIFRNQEACYNIFFAAVKKTLLTVGENNLKARLGFFGILHTWGQKLSFHPHIHCVVPGGGISLDGSRWINSSKQERYFVPQKVLALIFRGIFIRALKDAYLRKKIILENGAEFETLLTAACAKPWVVHCKPPFAGPIEVIKYLARYTRKVAISNSRLLALESGTVALSYRDYTDGAQTKTAHLAASEFIRRFLLHVPMPKFVRIRHCGFLANGQKKQALARCRELLSEVDVSATGVRSSEQAFEDTFRLRRCPHCQLGTRITVRQIQAQKPNFKDSS